MFDHTQVAMKKLSAQVVNIEKAKKLDDAGSKNIMDFLIDFEAVLEPPTPGQTRKNERAGAVEGGRGEA